MRTLVTKARVDEIADNYILPEPYETNREATLRFCFEWVVGTNYTVFENGKLLATDQELELAVDEYFNN